MLSWMCMLFKICNTCSTRAGGSFKHVLVVLDYPTTIFPLYIKNFLTREMHNTHYELGYLITICCGLKKQKKLDVLSVLTIQRSRRV